MMAPGHDARRAFLRRMLPGVLLLLILGLDVANGGQNVLGPTAMVPMLAANLLGPRATAIYGALTFAAAAAFGYDDMMASEATRNAQVTRLALLLLACGLALAAAVAKRRYEARLTAVQRVAEVAQRAILPRIPAVVGPLRLAAHYESAAAEASIGGDLYAVADTPYGVRLLIGDVRGKGLQAVHLASVLLGAFRERAHERDDLTTLRSDLDAAVRREAGDEDFVTALVLTIRGDGAVDVVTAGHPLPLVARGGSGATAVEAALVCPPLGLTGAIASPSLPLIGGGGAPLRLAAGDRLLLFTDGLSEARRSGDRAFFPAAAMVPPLLRQGELDEALMAVRKAVVDWGSSLSDDLALLAVEYSPPTPSGQRHAG